MTSRILYIGGEGRSGTTLLDQILGQIPGVTGTGELFAIWERGVIDDDLCGCGEAFSACPVWTAVGRTAFGGWSVEEARHMGEIRRSLVRDRYAPWLIRNDSWPTAPQQGDYFLAGLDRLYRASAATTGSEVIGDSSKYAGYAMVLSRLPDVDLRVVQLVRDARGAAFSLTKLVRKPEVAAATTTMDRYPPAVTAARWVKTDALFLALRARRVPLLTIRYEDLIDDPGAVVRRVADFADLPSGPGLFDMLGSSSVDLAPTHTVAGNPSRFRTGTVELALDERWRSGLGPFERGVVSGIAAPGLLRHGYVGPRRNHR